LQALETLKLLTNVGESLAGRLLLFDAASLSWREMKLPRDPQCGACGAIEVTPT
jgi:adenylyltransferase/sulfurtransferase